MTEEALVQIKIHGGGLDLWRKKEAGGRVFAKMTALERREGDNEESLDMIELRTGVPGSWPIVEAAVRKSFLNCLLVISSSQIFFHSGLDRIKQ